MTDFLIIVLEAKAAPFHAITLSCLPDQPEARIRLYDRCKARRRTSHRRTVGRTRLPDKDKGKNPAAVALGKLGGAMGGVARAAALSPAKRKEIAKKAARARWGKS